MTKSIAINTQRPWSLIKLCPSYLPTPITEISSPNGRRILVKNDTDRFNLGSFKALGGIYAVAAFLLDRWQAENHHELNPNELFENNLQNWANQFTFVCASAGNHGIAIAKGAKLFNSRCKVYLANNVPESFAKKLTALGAEVLRFGETYEDSVKAARENLKENKHNEILLADTSWLGYTKMPKLVMEGYTIIAEEMRRYFNAEGCWPSHVFLQAGVGGFAAAMTYHIREYWDRQPKIVVVEPKAAPCLSESIKLGRMTKVSGPSSNMGRLDCKEASLIAFELLQRYADDFICVEDSDAANAALFLAEKGIVTTPSGAAGMAGVQVSEQLNIPISNDAVCLIIATERPS